MNAIITRIYTVNQQRMRLIFNALDMPDDQRLLTVLGMMQICPEYFEVEA